MIKIDQTNGGEIDALYQTMAGRPGRKFTFGALFEVGDGTPCRTVHVGDSVNVVSKSYQVFRPLVMDS